MHLIEPRVHELVAAGGTIDRRLQAQGQLSLHTVRDLYKVILEEEARGGH